MGLDMYLSGRKFFWTDWENPSNNRTEDGLRVAELQVELGYWRKHPNLHGFIVKTFAEGVDECQEIRLDDEALKKIILACKVNGLPPTEGFFFGQSPILGDSYYTEQVNIDIEVLQKARGWLETKEPGVSRSVIYQASW